MSEGLALPPLRPGTLLAEDGRLERLHAAVPQILAIVFDETDAVALQATLACALWDALGHVNFCGFYRRIGPTTLAVGPYQGSMGCLRIDFSRGVCGRAARTGTMQRIDDVHTVPDHIACDDKSRSELVIPVFGGGELRAVLDIDSPHLAAFSAAEATLLETLVRQVFERPGVVF